MTENWRECGFAGDGVRNVSTARMCRLNATRNDNLPERYSWQGERMVSVTTCATCPVPERQRKADLWDASGENLVLAVRAAGRLLNALGGIGFNEMLEQYNPPGWSLCVANLVQAECLVAKADAALALLPEKEGDEHG